MSAWTESHPGLNPNVSYPGLDHVDALNAIAYSIQTLAESRDFYRGTRPEATFSDKEREHLTKAANMLREIAERKYQVLVDYTASGNISDGVYWRQDGGQP